MTLKSLVLVPVFALLGCVAAPREVETTLELGPQQVEIDVRLKDLRTSGKGDLNQLRIFSEFAAWNPEWITDFPWAPTPSRFEYISDGGQLDVAMHGSMSRADFDRCARAASDAGVCDDFPLELGKSGYSVRPQLLASKELVVDPRAKTAWAADAGRISYRVGLSDKDAAFISSGPSLRQGHALYRAAPANAVETLKRVEALEKVFMTGPVVDLHRELAALDACTAQPWCQLQHDAVLAEQLRLVHAYLGNKPEAGEGIAPAPARHLEFTGLSYSSALPKDAFAPIDDLRLRVRYDLLLAEFQQRGWVQPEANGGWAKVCRPDTMRKPALKDFCGRLGVRAKK